MKAGRRSHRWTRTRVRTDGLGFDRWTCKRCGTYVLQTKDQSKKSLLPKMNRDAPSCQDALILIIMED